MIGFPTAETAKAHPGQLLYRTQLADKSVVDVVFETEKPVTVEEVNAALKAAAERCIAVVEESGGNGSFLRELDN